MSKKQQNLLKVHYNNGQVTNAPDNSQKEEKNMSSSSGGKSNVIGILTKLLPWLSVLLLALLSFYYLLGRNADVLYMAQFHSLFVSGQQFFDYRMQTPGGFLQWAGCWFTQLFYYPWLGTLVLTILWILTFYILKKAFRISNAFSPLILVPLFCLLSSEIDLGYWIYYLKMPGYWFRETLGLMSVAILVLLSQKWEGENRILGIAQKIVIPILVSLTYPLIGYYSVVAGACIVITQLITKRWIGVVVALIATIMTPLIVVNQFDSVPFGETYSVGFPIFKALEITDDSLSMPFYTIIVALIVFALLPLLDRLKEKGKLAFPLLSIIVAVIFAWQVGKMEYDDDLYKIECKVYPEVTQQRWDDALTDISSCSGTLTRELIVLKNICLFNTGDIGNRIYEFDDRGMAPAPSDSLHVQMVQLAAPFIYNQHGMTNYAVRWGIENSVELGYNIDNLQQLTIAALVNGEMKVARRYLNILERTMYYKDWAAHYIPLTENPKLISQYKELDHIRDIHTQFGDKADSDLSLCERFINNCFSQIDLLGSKYSQEMTLVYALGSKDIQRFWPKYMQYLSMHKGEKVPVAYQQAAFLYGNLEPQTAPDPRQYDLGIDKAIKDAYVQFQTQSQQLVKSGLSAEAIGDNMKSQYGDTFWWTYFFNRGSKYY